MSQVFKRDIATADSQEIRLYLAAKASKFNAESPTDCLLRYYKSWKPPRSPADSALADIVAVVTEIHRAVTTNDPRVDVAALLSSVYPMFALTASCDTDSMILDHCKMHYIAANAIVHG
ncbi:hypothetical protein [Rubripirellula tenax]|uniref:hypothetical protein n=1 Tax=Rubripirellula tenax TaxID=2528015 RepID=UPI0011B7E5F7|nr:hypothetical protein [Rubripirellula tenax]